MEKQKKMTLQDLMIRAEQRQAAGRVSKNVVLPGLGGALTVEKIPLARMLSLLDGVDAESMTDNLSFQVELIYQCCPLMRNHELQEAYQCAEPTDVVCAVLDDNLRDVAELAEEILALYGLSGDALKN